MKTAESGEWDERTKKSDLRNLGRDERIVFWDKLICSKNHFYAEFGKIAENR